MGGGRVLALDLGTSSVRALVFDDRGTAVPDVLARRATELVVGDDGRAELDPDAIVDAVAACLDELAGPGHLDEVTTVATSCLWHSVLAADERGRPLSRVLTWADTRAASLVTRQRERTDPDRLQRRTGALPHTTFWTVKVPWLAGQAASTPASFLGLAEYVGLRLLGDASASVSMASGTGLLDLDAMTWEAEALELAGVDETSVPAVAPAGWRGRLAGEPARRWPQLAEADWHPATGDGAASNVGAGCTRPDRANVNVGTSSAVRAVHDDPRAPIRRELWRYRVDHRRVVTGAAFSSGGNLYAWAQEVLRLPDPAALEAELALVPPGARGVVVLPYLAGSRAPLDLLAGSGVIGGLSLANTAVDLVAAILESECFRLAAGFEALEAVLPGQVEVVGSGGALLASPWFQQTLADALGRPVRIVDEPEASARGAALVALDLTTNPETARVVQPRPEAVEALRVARAAHEDLAGRLGYT